VSCILVLLSFRSIAQNWHAHTREVDILNWRGTPAMCSASSLSGRVLTQQFPVALGRFRHPHAVGARGLAAVSDYLSARKGTTIDPMRALG